MLDWARLDAGGVLGLWFPALASSEILHFAYNLGLLRGLTVLLPGFRGHARTWWIVALIVQGWHFLEHLLLQIQWLTGWYLFGAEQQTSLLQLWLPRVELHFLYNTVVFIPMMVAMVLHSRRSRGAYMFVEVAQDPQAANNSVTRIQEHTESTRFPFRR